MEKCGTTTKKTPKYTPVTHVIFDLDGTLIASEPIYEAAHVFLCKKMGKEFTQDVRIKIMGTTEMDTAKLVVENLNLPLTPEEYQKKFLEKASETLSSCALLPGAERLVRHLHKYNIPMAIATSSAQESYELKCGGKPLFELFHHVVCGSSDPDVKKGKPSPDIFLVCASRFDEKPCPQMCLVFEDAPNGSRGAVAAKMQVVQIPDKSVDRALCQHSTLILDSMEQFVPEEFGLPAYCKCVPNICCEIHS